MREFAKFTDVFLGPWPILWTDHLGETRRVPSGQKLRFSKVPSHAALRSFVYRRDLFTCRRCGARAVDAPADYDGRCTLQVNRKWINSCLKRYGVDPNCHLAMDHVVSLRNGGSNHPDNLQTLCDSCNCAKATTFDAPLTRHLAHA